MVFKMNSFSHFIPPKQAASPHGLCDDWFLNQKNKGNEQKGHELLRLFPQAPREMPEIFPHCKRITLDHQV